MKKMLVIIVGLLVAAGAFAGSRGVVCAAEVAGSAGEEGRRAASLRLLVERADSGVARDMYALSGLVERGEEGFAADTVRALGLLRGAAEQGYGPACNYLGYCFFRGGLGLKADADSAVYWLERGAMAGGDGKAMANLGLLLLFGEGGVSRDAGKAAYWLGRAAEQGVPSALEALGEMYVRGEGVDKDTVRGSELLEQAALKGVAPAQVRLWDVRKGSLEGMSPQELAEVAKGYIDRGLPILGAAVLEETEATESAYGKALLGISKMMGRGTGYDYGGGMALLIEAAREGDVSALYLVGETLWEFPDTPGAEGITAEECMERARAGGVTSAREALERL